MAFGIDVDVSEFERAITEIHAATNRGMAEIVNGMARDVSFMAIRETKAANRADIEALPGLRYVSWTDPVTGKSHDAPLWCLYIAKRLRRAVSVSRGAITRVVREGGASKMMGKLLRRRGKVGQGVYYAHEGIRWTRPQARVASRTIINARKRAVNFIRAGFIPAARIFAAATARDGGPQSYRVFGYEYGVSKGGASIAVPGENPTAELWNSALSNQKYSSVKGGVAALIRYAGDGLNQAIDKVATRELEWAQQKMAREFRAFWAR